MERGSGLGPRWSIQNIGVTMSCQKKLSPTAIEFSWVKVRWTFNLSRTEQRGYLKYVGCFQGTVYQDRAHLHNCLTKNYLQSVFSFTSYPLCIKVANLVLCCITLVWFPSDRPLRTETCSDVQCDSVMWISKGQFCAFCWVSVANWLSIMRGIKNINCNTSSGSSHVLGVPLVRGHCRDTDSVVIRLVIIAI